MSTTGRYHVIRDGKCSMKNLVDCLVPILDPIRPPTPCAAYSLGCCSGDRSTVYCSGGSTTPVVCGMGLACGPITGGVMWCTFP